MIRTTAGTAEPPGREYLFRTASDLGHAQMRYLEALLDGPTTDLLSTTRPRPGWRCLEVGAGGGSVARWMAQRTAPGGEVVAVDLTTERLGGIPGVTAHQHDITEGLPVDGPFDLIHARLVMLHLPQRLEVLDQLVDALAPGGWLLIGDFGPRPPRAIPTEGPRDADLFDRLMEIGHRVFATSSGQSPMWALEVADHMATRGLVDIQSRKHSQIVTGNDLAARYLHTLATEIQPQLLAAGLSQEELDRCGAALMDPRFRAWFYQFVSSLGRAPTAP